jgi:hypothetical protein
MVLTPHPSVVRDLVERYEGLKTLAAPEAGPDAVRRTLDDVVYALCVCTGTRTEEAALTVAHRLLEAEPVTDRSRAG